MKKIILATLIILLAVAFIGAIIFINKSADDSVSWYQPTPGISWQWQLTGSINSSHNVDLYDVDLVDTSQAVIDELHGRNIMAICYFSAGSLDESREDASGFPKEVVGKTLDDWPDEKWLDVTNYKEFKGIIEKRLDLAVQKNCDGVEPDNIDGFQNESGFDITPKDQIAYNRWLASAAHERQLSIGLKNDLDQVDELVDFFDFAINEQCFQYNECEKLLPFIEEDKAVLGVEYELEPDDFCAEAKRLKYSWLKMDVDLDGSRVSCE